jgi:serine/threonine protein kinase
MAPEVRERYQYNARISDVFSLGVTLYSMVHGLFPFEDSTNTNTSYGFIRRGEWEAFWKGKPESSEEVRELLWRMLARDPQTRPSLEQILSHPWTSQSPSQSEATRKKKDPE